jgi:MtN3 and saliva related transmembrane protein
MNPEIIGFLAGLLTTAAYVPQVVKLYREKDAGGVSLGMYVLMAIGLGLWLVYGLWIGKPSLIVANGVAFLFSLLILLGKIKYR